MNRFLSIAVIALSIAALPATALGAYPTAVSSSAQEVPDAVGDASSGADLTAFSLSQTAKTIDFGWTFAPGVDIRSQQLQVCAVGHARTACIVSPTRVRVEGRYYKVRVSYIGRRVTAHVPATALGYPEGATSRTIRFRAKVGLMRSECGGPCTDFSPAAVAGIEL